TLRGGAALGGYFLSVLVVVAFGGSVRLVGRPIGVDMRGGDVLLRADSQPLVAAARAAGDALAADGAFDHQLGSLGGQADRRVLLAGSAAHGQDRNLYGRRRSALHPQVADGDPAVVVQPQAVQEGAIRQVDARRITHVPAELVGAVVVAIVVGGLRLGLTLRQIGPGLAGVGGIPVVIGGVPRPDIPYRRPFAPPVGRTDLHRVVARAAGGQPAP